MTQENLTHKILPAIIYCNKILWQCLWHGPYAQCKGSYFGNPSHFTYQAVVARKKLRGRLHGAFSTSGLNSALLTGLTFQPRLAIQNSNQIKRAITWRNCQPSAEFHPGAEISALLQPAGLKFQPWVELKSRIPVYSYTRISGKHAFYHAVNYAEMGNFPLTPCHFVISSPRSSWYRTKHGLDSKLDPRFDSKLTRIFTTAYFPLPVCLYKTEISSYMLLILSYKYI